LREDDRDYIKVVIVVLILSPKKKAEALRTIVGVREKGSEGKYQHTNYQYITTYAGL
jgi:hypothetical protein